MNFALSEDHLVLRQSARTFVEKEISLARVLVPGATVEDADYAVNWGKIAAMGWPGLVIDEAYDGLGLSCIDLAMILGEMGRTPNYNQGNGKDHVLGPSPEVRRPGKARAGR